MRQLTIREADVVYCYGSKCCLNRHRVQHDQLAKFCIDVGELRKCVAGSESGDYWNPVLRLLRRIRFEVNAFPVPFSRVIATHAEALQRVRQKLDRCHLTHPDFADIASEVAKALDWLSTTHDNPLLESIVELLCADAPSHLALLLKESRGVSPARDILNSAGYGIRIDVIVADQLREDARYGMLIVVGPTKWYPDYVFTAPRAGSIDVIHYAGIKDRWTARPVFLGSQTARGQSNSRPRRGRVPTEIDAENDTGDFDAVLDPIDDALPDIDWRSVAGRINQRASTTTDTIVPARMFLLDGGYAVLLDAGDGAYAPVVDLDQEPDDRVRMINIRKIECGMFVVLRSGGGGDYVIDVANQLLGNKASSAREAQRQWKMKLAEVVRAEGMGTICQRLSQYGAVRATPQNVRNWMSYRNIKTENFDDFLAIMRLVGMENKAEQLWKTMTKIAQAHKTAGQRIRRMLLSKIRQADEWEMQRLGHMEFAIPEVSCGGISVYRVIGIHDAPVEVPEGEIGRLLKDGGDEWQ